MDVPDIDTVVHEPDPAFVEDVNVTCSMRGHDIEDYDELIEQTTTEVLGVGASGAEWLWGELVDYLDVDFYEEYDVVRDDSEGLQFPRWYLGGEINVAHNTLDHHAVVGSGNQNRVACIWEGESDEVVQRTYHNLCREVNCVANVLESYGVEIGDTVGLYMPMVPEAISVLYGCLKVGTIAVPISSGLGVDATMTRLVDPECSVLFTADGLYRRGSEVRLKSTADEAIEEAGYAENAVIYRWFGNEGDENDADVPWTEGRDEWWDDTVGAADSEYEAKRLPSDVESMLLYSPGTTGKSKGIVRTYTGVRMQIAKEIHFGLDQEPKDRFFWVFDTGWMMGLWTLIGSHTPAGTIFMYEGAPDYPNSGRFWETIEHHRITTSGISPTAIRALRKHGDEEVEKHDLSSFCLLGSVGEPWDPESWQWFYEHVGGGEAPIINISGGTEICGCFLILMPTQPFKLCSLDDPDLGMDIDIVDPPGEPIADSHERGFLVARDSCPSITKSLQEGDDRYLDTYWPSWDGLQDYGDWAQEDEDGLQFLHGHVDDAFNAAGRKVGPAEVEGAFIEHDAVSQAAVAGVPDDITGTAVAVYIVLEDGIDESDDLREELRGVVGDELGKPFRPWEIPLVDELPKTQSGKIIRRAIASIYAGGDLGDMGSIENPESFEKIENTS